MEWRLLGTLAKGVEEKYRRKRGVYMEIFPGKCRRIIYLGTTADGFGKRPGDYWTGPNVGYLKRKHYAFKATKGEDVYEMGMRLHDGESRFDYSRRVHCLVQESKLWIPGLRPWKLEEDNLWEDGRWEEFFREHFSDVELWGCETPVPFDEEIESRLQVALGMLFRLGYHDQRQPQNWLGRIQCFRDDKRKSIFGRKEKFGAGKFETKLTFPEDNLHEMDLDEKSMSAFRDESNSQLIRDYFEEKERRSF